MRETFTMINRCFVILMLACGLLAGCSGIKTYPNTPDKNLRVRTEADSGSFFSKVRAAVDIYRVDADCKTEYEGTVQLDAQSVEVGVPSGRVSYLVFVFARSGFFSRSSSSISYDTLLRPRAGQTYDVSVRYRDDIYNVVIREAGSSQGKGRVIGPKDLQDCRSF
jgi:hypothetical protein